VGEGVLIGLDVGTTSSKAVVYTTEGHAVADGRAPTIWSTTASGVQMDARDLLAGAIDAVNQALAQTSGVAVLGLGVASMGESGVLVDRHGRPVAPVIAWHDTRDRVELAELGARLGADTFSARTGLPFLPQWSLTKHHWLVRHHTEAAEAVRRLNIGEWIVHGLGGEEASELSLASRTGWLDLATRTWWAESLSATQMKESLLPPLVAAGTALGGVANSAVSTALADAVLTVAGHDHQAAAVGAGAVHAGDELDSCGTAEALVRTVQPNLPEETIAELARAGITTGWHVLAQRWCLLGGTEGGRTLQRVRALLGEDGEDLHALDAAALAVSPLDMRGLVLEVTSERVVVSGANENTRPEHIWRSALEHVTREAKLTHVAMSRLSGPLGHLVVTGGWSNSRALLHVKRDMLGPLERSGVSQAGCRGAALLAGLAAGVYETTDQFPDPA
jgi:sugar (pentulose or hexulose) kinase